MNTLRRARAHLAVPTLLVVLCMAACDRPAVRDRKPGDLTVHPNNGFASVDSVPTEWPLPDAGGKGVAFDSLTGPLLGVFTRGDAVPEDSLALAVGSPGVGEVFYVHTPGTIPVPEGARKLLLIPGEEAATSVTVQLRLLDTAPPGSRTRFVQHVADAYVPIDPASLRNDDEFLLEVLFDHDPGESSRVVWFDWDAGTKEPAEVIQVEETPRLFRSRPISCRTRE